MEVVLPVLMGNVLARVGVSLCLCLRSFICRHEFEWKRQECFIIRKPDPPVLVAVTKEPPGKLKTTAIQILDYNINRFDIEDRKGLEIVILTSLLTFHDLNDAYHATPTEVSPQSSSSAVPTVAGAGTGDGPPPPYRSFTADSNTGDTQVLSNVGGGQAPPLPLKPPIPETTGIDKVAEAHAMRGDVNEITIEEDGSVEDYAQYALGLLEDDAMLFITIQSFDAKTVPKVLQVVEETKRIRHKRSRFHSIPCPSFSD